MEAGDTMREARFESNEPRTSRSTSHDSLASRFASLPLLVQTLLVDGVSAELSESRLLSNDGLLEVLKVFERSGERSFPDSFDRRPDIASASSDDAPSVWGQRSNLEKLDLMK